MVPSERYLTDLRTMKWYCGRSDRKQALVRVLNLCGICCVYLILEYIPSVFMDLVYALYCESEELMAYIEEWHGVIHFALVLK